MAYAKKFHLWPLLHAMTNRLHEPEVTIVMRVLAGYLLKTDRAGPPRTKRTLQEIAGWPEHIPVDQAQKSLRDLDKALGEQGTAAAVLDPFGEAQKPLAGNQATPADGYNLTLAGERIPCSPDGGRVA
jgi:hypothetical protein